MTQWHLPSGVNYAPGVNAARQPQHSMDARNTMYTYPPPPPHHPYYPMRSDSYEQGTGAYHGGRDMHDGRVPAPRQEYSGYCDGRVIYDHYQGPAPRHDGLDLRQNWPRYAAYPEDGRMIHANSMSPLPGLMQYSSSPPQSEGN